MIERKKKKNEGEIYKSLIKYTYNKLSDMQLKSKIYSTIQKIKTLEGSPFLFDLNKYYITQKKPLVIENIQWGISLAVPPRMPHWLFLVFHI